VRRVAAGSAFVVVCLASLSTAAWANDGHTDGHADPGSGTIGAAAGASGATGGGGGTSHKPSKPATSKPTTKPACTYTAVDPATAAQLDAADPHPPGSGHWDFKTCNGKFVGPVWIPSAGAGQDAKTVQLPLPDAGISPTGDQLVRLPMWVWIKNWAPVSVTASGGGVSSTVTGTPQSATWNFGDGTPVISCGPGRAGTSDCSHTYSKSSADQPGEAYTVTVTTRWHVTWAASGAAGGGDLGFIDRTSTFPIRVGEQQSINNG
jgi:hypothetical protein